MLRRVREGEVGRREKNRHDQLRHIYKKYKK